MTEMTEGCVLAVAGAMQTAGDHMDSGTPDCLIVIGIRDGEVWGVIGGDITNAATSKARAALKKLCQGPEVVGCRELEG